MAAARGVALVVPDRGARLLPLRQEATMMNARRLGAPAAVAAVPSCASPRGGLAAGDTKPANSQSGTTVGRPANRQAGTTAGRPARTRAAAGRPGNDTMKQPASGRHVLPPAVLTGRTGREGHAGYRPLHGLGSFGLPTAGRSQPGGDQLPRRGPAPWDSEDKRIRGTPMTRGCGFAPSSRHRRSSGLEVLTGALVDRA
jgi:hypothetical protein